MPRILHIFAIICLIGSVAYSYRVKYHSIGLTNEIVRLKKDIERARNEIAEAKAEWQVLNNPDRLQKLADAHTTTTNMRVTQIIRWSDLPNRPPPSDPIADKLMTLGNAHSPAEKAQKPVVALGIGEEKKSSRPQTSLPLAQATPE